MPKQKIDLNDEPFARIQDDFKDFDERFGGMRSDDVFVSADAILGTDFDGNYRDRIRAENAEKKAAGESLKTVTDYYGDFTRCFSFYDIMENVQKNMGV